MEKKKYTTPQLQLIELDNEISLALESTTPPDGPDEAALYPEYLNNNPFRNYNSSNA